MAGAAGGLAAYKAATRHKTASEPGAPEPPPAQEPPAPDDDPAEELRAKLAEARADEPEPQGPDARRQAVHDEARSALDEMHSGET
jgi:hypothetical protein